MRAGSGWRPAEAETISSQGCGILRPEQHIQLTSQTTSHSEHGTYTHKHTRLRSGNTAPRHLPDWPMLQFHGKFLSYEFEHYNGTNMAWVHFFIQSVNHNKDNFIIKTHINNDAIRTEMTKLRKNLNAFYFIKQKIAKNICKRWCGHF